MFNKLCYFLAIAALSWQPLAAQDTSAYETQRQKINALLAERSAKFGQYDESLNTRTGIFGLQTKRDIRNSNDILRQIALNDNEIFKELKVLLDYKDLQVQQAKTYSTTHTESLLNYRKTIKTLQEQNQQYRTTLDRAEKSRDLAYLLLAVCLLGCAILGYLFISKLNTLKRYEKTNV